LDENSAKKLDTIQKREKEARKHLVGEESGIQRDGFAIGICYGDLLGAGGKAGSCDAKSVGILEGDAGGFSVDGDR